MGKLLSFRRRSARKAGQRELFEPQESAPFVDLTIRPTRGTDARPSAPGSDALPLPLDDRPGEIPPETLRRRRRRRRLTLAALAVVFVVGTFAAVFGERGFVDVRQEKEDLARVRAEVEATQERVAALKSRVDALKSDPAAIERIAREELGYVEPGEIAVILPESAIVPDSKSK